MSTTAEAQKNETILQEAERIINGARRVDYGPVEDSFVDIAARWTQELSSKLTEDITPFDVVHLMVQLKLSRAKNGYHRDSYVDIGGYVGCTEKLTIETPEPSPRQWERLEDVPKDVAVLSAGGTYWSFWTYARALAAGKDYLLSPRSSGSWLWTDKHSKLDHPRLECRTGPFTETEKKAH